MSDTKKRGNLPLREVLLHVSPAEFSAQTPALRYFNGILSDEAVVIKIRILLEQSDSLEM